MAYRVYRLRSVESEQDIVSCARQLFALLGPLQARAWPDFFAWANSWSEGSGVVARSQPEVNHLLTPEECATFISPDVDCIYFFEEADPLIQTMIAATRHSELAAVFLPRNLTREQVIETVGFMDHFWYTRDIGRVPHSVDWTIAISHSDDGNPTMCCVAADEAVLLNVDRIVNAVVR